jgi:hypothetical protein
MPIAGNDASVRTSDNTLTVNVASASTLVAGGGGLKERIEKLKVGFLY